MSHRLICTSQNNEDQFQSGHPECRYPLVAIAAQFDLSERLDELLDRKTARRRTIVAVGAWSAPTVAMAVTAPANATPSDPATGISLLTDEPPAVPADRPTTYAIDWHVVQSDGSPAKNVPVTVTLYDGAAFTNGSTVRIFFSGADGNVSIAASIIILGSTTAPITGELANGATAGGNLPVR